MLRLKKVLAAVVLAGTLGAGTANAAFINGLVSLSDGFDQANIQAGLSVVSALVFVVPDAVGSANGCTGDFRTAGVCTSSTFTTGIIDLALPPDAGIFTNGVFVFDAAIYTNIIRTALSCSGGQCGDELSFRISGTVDDGAGGFDPTIFTGVFTANGTCQEGAIANTCNGESSASWSISLVALGRSTVPEPGTLALLAVALAGLGFVRVRTKS